MKHPLYLALILVGCVGGGREPQVPLTSRTAVGPGFYSSWLDPAEKPPTTSTGAVAKPKVTPGFRQLPTTNEWWSSLIWQWNDGKEKNPYSENMFPHPLTMRARTEGLELGYPTHAVVTPRHYDFPHRPDLLVGVEGLHAPRHPRRQLFGLGRHGGLARRRSPHVAHDGPRFALRLRQRGAR